MSHGRRRPISPAPPHRSASSSARTSARRTRRSARAVPRGGGPHAAAAASAGSTVQVVTMLELASRSTSDPFILARRPRPDSHGRASSSRRASSAPRAFAVAPGIDTVVRARNCGSRRLLWSAQRGARRQRRPAILALRRCSVDLSHVGHHAPRTGTVEAGVGLDVIGGSLNSPVPVIFSSIRRHPASCARSGAARRGPRRAAPGQAERYVNLPLVCGGARRCATAGAPPPSPARAKKWRSSPRVLLVRPVDPPPAP